MPHDRKVECSWLTVKVQRDNFGDVETREGMSISLLSDVVTLLRVVCISSTVAVTSFMVSCVWLRLFAARSRILIVTVSWLFL